MQPHPVSRRQILTLAGLTLGAGIVDLSRTAEPAYAAQAGGPILQPIANAPVPVLFGDGTAPSAAPRQLAIRVVRTGGLPAGTRIAITFDSHRYEPLTPAIITLDGRPVAAHKTLVTDPKTGQHTSTITLTRAVASTGELIAIIGTARPLLYPHDLARHAPTATAHLRRSSHAKESQHSLQPARPSAFGGPAQPWGIELGAVWDGRSWGKNGKYHYPVPVRVTLHSVGPGPAPDAVAFAVSLDPRLASAVKISSAQLNHRRLNKRIKQTHTLRTGSILRTQWRAPVRLAAGDVLDVYLEIATVAPHHQLTGVKYPDIAVVASGATTAQRLTGRESLTRTDVVCADVADG